MRLPLRKNGRDSLFEEVRVLKVSEKVLRGVSFLYVGGYFLETNLASRWEGVRLPRASGKSPDFPGSSPNFPGSFSATSPEVLSLWNSTAIQGFPGSFPDFPGSSPDFPGSFPDFPGGQPLLWGSLTPSPDSQKLSLNFVLFCSWSIGSRFKDTRI